MHTKSSVNQNNERRHESKGLPKGIVERRKLPFTYRTAGTGEVVFSVKVEVQSDGENPVLPSGAAVKLENVKTSIGVGGEVVIEADVVAVPLAGDARVARLKEEKALGWKLTAEDEALLEPKKPDAPVVTRPIPGSLAHATPSGPGSLDHAVPGEQGKPPAGSV